MRIHAQKTAPPDVVRDVKTPDDIYAALWSDGIDPRERILLLERLKRGPSGETPRDRAYAEAVVFYYTNEAATVKEAAAVGGRYRTFLRRHFRKAAHISAGP
jgi:hypothetical protein